MHEKGSQMTATDKTVRTKLRIPGAWSNPAELIEQLPDGFCLNESGLVLPDGTEIEMYPVPPDDQFASVFAASCRSPATEDELETINR